MASEDQVTVGGGFTLKLNGSGVSIDKEVDSETAQQIVSLVIGGRSSRSKKGRKSARPTRSSESVKGKRPGGSKRKRTSLGTVKDLGFWPEGKSAFEDVVAERKPTTHQERIVVAVHWLRNEAGLESGITASHLNSCYRNAGWRRPSDLKNALATTAAKKGWLDTSDMDNITLTASGEDYVEHELPHQSDT